MKTYQTQPFRIGVCSWSLNPDNPADLVDKVLQTGLKAVQLALDPVRKGEWQADETANTLRNHNITILSAMMAMRGEDYSTLESIRNTGGVRPDRYWEDNIKAANENAVLARQLGISMVTCHGGFIPENTDDPERTIMINRLRTITDIFANHNIKVALETGQETASTLLGALIELKRPDTGVNFDPANMILYGKGNPTEAISHLAPHITQIHIKDALPSDSPRKWGTEVPVGEGAVDWRQFAQTIRERKIQCNLIIERESGNNRIDDIRAAVQILKRKVIPPVTI